MKWLNLTLIACLAQICAGSFAQSDVSDDGAWTRLDSTAAISARSTPAAQKWVDPERYSAFSINGPVAKAPAYAAPAEAVSHVRNSSTMVTVPRPDGSFERFQIIDVPTMEPELAAKYPDIKTFVGVGVDDPTATVRGDVSPHGFRASVRNSFEPYYVDPLYQGNSDFHVSYYLKDSGDPTPFECHSDDVIGAAVHETLEQGTAAAAFGGDFRTYRLAMASTAEYTAAAGGTVASTMAVFVSLVNRLNQIMEADVAVRLILIGNTDDLIFMNAATDGYTDGNTPNLLNENQAIVPPLIGNANFDVSHVMNSGGGGRASGQVVCDNTIKCRGTTGITNGGILGNRGVVFLAHEVGHQFGAGHTFNGLTANCNPGNYQLPNAYEPGAGNTIMGYANTCGIDDYDATGGIWDAYYHRHSLNQIQTFISGTTCDVSVASGNTPPQINGGSDIVVPVSTPFKLKAAGSDVDGDEVFYCWEQFDKASGQRTLGSPDPGDGPLMRSFFPTNNPARYFPFNPANPTPEEQLPTVANRALTFVVTGRDFRTAGGGTNDDEVLVNIINPVATPFRVTVGNTPGEVWAGSTQVITWDVAGTDALPFNIFNVNIMLSVDGGDTYPYMLMENTPNDGEEMVPLPNVTSTQVRIRVEPFDSGVFDISDADIVMGGKIDINPVVMDYGITCEGDVIDRSFQIFNTGNGDLTVSDVTIFGSASFTLVPTNGAPQPGLPVVIPPGSHVDYSVNYVAPNLIGPITATVTVASSDPVRPSVDITATATGGEPDISTIIANNGNFGDVCLGEFKDYGIRISNDGNCDLRITSIDSGLADFVLPSVMNFPLVVQGGTSILVPIRFSPTSLGPKASTITINSNDIDQPAVDVAVSGNAPGGTISVTPCPIDFGLVCPEDAAAVMKEITVCNTGKCPLNVSGVSISGVDFQLEGVPALPVTVQSGSCFTFTVKFAPVSIGPKSEMLTVTSDDPDNPVVNCMVTGDTVANIIGVPERIAFQPAIIASVGHCPVDEPLTITNIGMCNVMVSNVTISGVNADSFSLVGLPSSSDPLSIASGEQLGDGSLYVRFNPESMLTERFHSAQVDCTYITDPFTMAEATVSIPLMGEAVQNGFRVLVRAGGVPVDNVLQIQARVKGVKANGKNGKAKLKMKNATLRNVDAPAPFNGDLSFAYHAEFGALTNSTQIPTGEVLMKVKFKLGKKKVTRTIRFHTNDTCTFNQNIVVDF